MQFAARTRQIQHSHIREILKVAADPAMISFAGGLPNPDLFPVEGIAAATAQVFDRDGQTALQYANSEGLPALREWISARYRTLHDLEISPEEILITSGSQQALDLLGKTLIDPGQPVIVEEPAYLGALQAFAMYEPRFHHAPLENDGVDVDALEKIVEELKARAPDRTGLFYTTPDFQNPAGVTCSAAKRHRLAGLADRMTIIEDNPYGELVYEDSVRPPLLRKLDDRIILLGSFSKIVSPGVRVGWVCAKGALFDRLVIARQAADLHTSSLAQMILERFLRANDLDQHVRQLRDVYRRNRNCMLHAIEAEFPAGAIEMVRPGGGMFLWCRLTQKISAEALFHEAMRENVLFVPGGAFYPNAQAGATVGDRHLRLNFSNASPDSIREGIGRLARAYERCVARPVQSIASGEIL